MFPLNALKGILKFNVKLCVTGNVICLHLSPSNLAAARLHHEHMNHNLNWIINQDLCSTYV